MTSLQSNAHTGGGSNAVTASSEKRVACDRDGAMAAAVMGEGGVGGVGDRCGRVRDGAASRGLVRW
jgi:hypothetical protein